MTDRELLQQSLELITKAYVNSDIAEAIRARLAQPEQEPNDVVVAELDKRLDQQIKEMLEAIMCITPQRKPMIDVLIDAKNSILWLKRRLPKAYESPPHIQRCIEDIDCAIRAIGDVK